MRKSRNLAARCSHFGSSCAILGLSAFGRYSTAIRMATSAIELAVLDQLCGCVSEVGLDIVRHQLLPRKGLAGFLRKNGLLPELDNIDAFDEKTVSMMPSLVSSAPTTGHCIHCIQDAGHGKFEPCTELKGYLVATDNCSLHSFRGDLGIEAAAVRLGQRVGRSVGSSRGEISRERLPFAMVYVDERLVTSCQQQLIRQCTKPDSGAFGDCFAFGVRTVEGMRDRSDRVSMVKLHFIIAARLLWLPNTITDLTGWIPVSPMSPDGVYRRHYWENVHFNSTHRRDRQNPLRAVFPSIQRSTTLVVAEDYPVDHIPSQYELNNWAVPGLDGVEFGPHNVPDFYLPPEDEPEEMGRVGRNGPCETGLHATDKCVVRKWMEQNAGGLLREISAGTGLSKQATNRALYALERDGVVTHVSISPAAWTVNQDKWVQSIVDNLTEMDRISDARPDPVLKATKLETEFPSNKAPKVTPTDSSHIERGEHRDSPDQPLTGFSTHPLHAAGVGHSVGDVTYLGEKHAIELRGGKATLDYRSEVNANGTKELREALKDEARMNISDSCLSGLEERVQQAWCGTWEPVHDGKLEKVFLAKPSIGNAVSAMKNRHFKISSGVGVMTEKGKRHTQRAAHIVRTMLTQQAHDEGKLSEIYDILETIPEEFKSGKWTRERFLTALRKCGVDTAKEMKRQFGGQTKRPRNIWKISGWWWYFDPLYILQCFVCSLQYYQNHFGIFCHT